MKVITRYSKAQEAPDRWREIYGSGRYNFEGQEIISDKLQDLKGRPINPDDVDRIIGNGAWTRVPPCDECLQDRPIVVEIGEKARVCQPCLSTALAMAIEGGRL